MDPNTALANLRSALRRAAKRMDDDTDDARFCVVPNGTVSDAMEAFAALDGWLSSGGFLPSAWDDIRNVQSENCACQGGTRVTANCIDTL
jgi:hypothetical protein